MNQFELKKGVELPDLPAFPLDEFIHAMSAEERKIIMAVYMAKTVDFIQGRKDVSNVRSPIHQGRSLPDSHRDLERNLQRENAQINCVSQDHNGDALPQDRKEAVRKDF